MAGGPPVAEENTSNINTTNGIILERTSPSTMMMATTTGTAPHHNNNNNINMVNGNHFENQSPTVQFTILAFGVFLFFGLHNYLQEAIMSVPGWHYGVMLGYWEVFGVTVCSYIERRYIAQETKQVAPMSAYPLLTVCLMSSSSLSNIALNYINFPTKVVFRSCKLIPTMFIASILHKKVFSSVEYVCAVAVCLGLVMFAAAEWDLSPTFHPIGLAFVSLSVCADAILPNAQERLFRMGSTRLEVTFFTNIFALIAMTVTTLLSGDLMGMLQLARGSTVLCTYIVVYTFIAYVAISIHMNVVRRFGGVAAVLLATGRKGMTLVLSFILFPKAFSWYYVWGAILVLGGLLFSSLHKIQQKNSKKRKDLQHKSSDIIMVGGMNMVAMGPTTVSSTETKRLLGTGVAYGDDQNSSPYDVEHHGINVNTGKNSPDTVSALEIDDAYESTSTSNSKDGSPFFGRSASHDHQQ